MSRKKTKTNCTEITSFIQLLLLGSLRGLQLLSRFEVLPDAPHWWARDKGTYRADALAFYVHQHHRGTGERRPDPSWQPSPATVDNQCGFGSVNVIEMFQGCHVPLSQPVFHLGCHVVSVCSVEVTDSPCT